MSDLPFICRQLSERRCVVGWITGWMTLHADGGAGSASQSSLGCTYTLLTSAFSECDLRGAVGGTSPIFVPEKWDVWQRGKSKLHTCALLLRGNYWFLLDVFPDGEPRVNMFYFYPEHDKKTDWSFCFLLKGPQGVPKIQGCAGMNLLGKVASVQSVSKWQIRGCFLLTELWCIWFGSLW